MHSITHLHRDNNTSTTDNIEHSTFDDYWILYSHATTRIRIKLKIQHQPKKSTFYYYYRHNVPQSIFVLTDLTVSKIFVCEFCFQMFSKEKQVFFPNFVWIYGSSCCMWICWFLLYLKLFEGVDLHGTSSMANCIMVDQYVDKTI